MKTKRVLCALLIVLTTLSVTMQIKYDGKGFDSKDSDNLLSLKLAENSAESITYEAIDNEGYTNLVTVKVK